MAVLPAPHPIRAARWTWLDRRTLDRLLLAGADPDGSPALRRRTRVLRRRRVHLAGGLERAVRAAALPRPRGSFSAAIPVDAPEVRATRRLLLELAFRIRVGADARPAGLLLTRRLLTDGGGPLFHHSASGALRDAAAEAILALGDAGSESV
jgi:hypothetical protein